jgi:WhiB family redox-sensing transcriptional regulator
MNQRLAKVMRHESDPGPEKPTARQFPASGAAVLLLVRQAAALAGPLSCREDPRLWFSDLPADLELAKALCRNPPLRGPCLAGAIERAQPCGVWGGEIFDRGVTIASKRPRGRPPGQPKEEVMHPALPEQSAQHAQDFSRK